MISIRTVNVSETIMSECRMIEAAKRSVLRHLWYLTKELVILALFDEALSNDERKEMANVLLATPKPAVFNIGKPVFPVERMAVNQQLSVFIGECSWLIFHKLGADGDWLNLPVDDWKGDEEYCRMRVLLKDMQVVNDPAEHCIKDIHEYCNLTMDPAYREDILLVATDHRGIFQDLRKANLR